MYDRESYLVSDFREQSTGPVEEVLSESHFVVVIFITPFAHRGVLPLLKPFILHHRQYCHARFPCEHENQNITPNLYGHFDTFLFTTVEEVVGVCTRVSLADGIVMNIMGILSGASSLLNAKKSSILKKKKSKIQVVILQSEWSGCVYEQCGHIK